MPKWRVLLQGRDVRLSMDGREQRGGFWIHACVEAPAEDQARREALCMLRAYPRYQALLAGELHEPAQPEPVLLVDEVEQLSRWDEHPLGVHDGFIFYVDDEEPPLQ